MADSLRSTQDPSRIGQILDQLEAARDKKKGSFLAKKSTFNVQGSAIRVDSWKLMDHDYKKPNLPTYARGLFTTTNSQGEPEIVVRGYDKFFNHGEVGETEWPNVINNTRGPYELSVKENGCIIFMAGLEDGTLIVCSKHSTGSRSDTDVSHAEWGAKWVDRHVQRVGKTRAELARTLRAMNATAVAELCDDEFEEHVLEYNPETAGLYLHGINFNLPDFATCPHSLVDQFAEEWGFRKTTYIVKNDINEVKSFLEGVAETGNYDGRDTEGFVIRCQSKANTGQWHDWFFKYKFEEPYLMYRQWRECTKAVISGKEPKYKKHKKITEEYLEFARRQLHGNKELAQSYNNNHGIIKMRDDFLASRGLSGSDIIRGEMQQAEDDDEAPSRDIMLVPVATIGCGKTSIALALVKLFGWGHVQNDNITVKKGKPEVFAKQCVAKLEDAPAMIADRNNHQKRERRQLIEDASKIVPSIKFVALHFRHDRDNYDRIRQATRDRVLSRGDNHQTIHASSKGQATIIEIMEGFMYRFEPVDVESPPDDDFDLVTDLDPLASVQTNVMIIINQLFERYPGLFPSGQLPTQEQVQQAIVAANEEYTIDVKHTLGNNKNGNQKPAKTMANTNQVNGGAKKQDKKVEYFGITVPTDEVLALLDRSFASVSPEVAHMYNMMKAQRRIQTEFHVTILHKAMAQRHARQWDQLQGLYDRQKASAPTGDTTLGEIDVYLDKVVWNERVMAFLAQSVPPGGELGEMSGSVNRIPHVTVGTANASIKPVESNDMLARWQQVGAGKEGFNELDFPQTKFRGSLRAVLAR